MWSQQPCAGHDGDRCTVYLERPVNCRSYTCDLYDRVRARSVGSDAAASTIARVKELRARVEAVVGSSPDHTVWERIVTTAPISEPEFLLDVAELKQLLKRHFDDA